MSAGPVYCGNDLQKLRTKEQKNKERQKKHNKKYYYRVTKPARLGFPVVFILLQATLPKPKSEWLQDRQNNGDNLSPPSANHVFFILQIISQQRTPYNLSREATVFQSTLFTKKKRKPKAQFF